MRIDSVLWAPILRNNTRSSRRIKTCVISGVVWMSLVGNASAGTVTFYQPMNDGGVGLDVGGFGLAVIGILATDSPAMKASKIVNKINMVVGRPAGTHVVTCPGAGATGAVTCTSGVVSTVDPKQTLAVTSDLTGEKLLFSSQSSSSGIKSLIGVLDYEGTLSGVDAFGAASTFSPSIGYDGLTDSATVTYSAGLTTAGLTSDIYADLLAGLPLVLQPDLTLNGTEIDFDVPLGETNYFVDSSTTDTGVQLTGGFETPTPEPASLFLCGTGLVVAIGLIRRRRLPRPCLS